MSEQTHILVYHDHANGQSNLRDILVSLGKTQLGDDEARLPGLLQGMAWTGGLFHVDHDVWHQICTGLKRDIIAIRCSNDDLPRSHKLTSGGGLAINCNVPIPKLTKADVALLLTMLANDDERVNLVAGIVPAGLRKLIPAGSTATIEAVKALAEALLTRAQRDRDFSTNDRLDLLKELSMELDMLKTELRKEASGLGCELSDKISNLLISTPSGDTIGALGAMTETVIIHEAYQELAKLLEG